MRNSKNDEIGEEDEYGIGKKEIAKVLKRLRWESGKNR